jgi:hypothetical protein
LLLLGFIVNSPNIAFGQKANAGKGSSGLNTLTPKEKAADWKLLFDGKSTEAWTGTKGKGFPEKGWVVENGILTVLGATGDSHASGGDIITKEQYGNFELALEFKIPKGANSGIKYFVVNNFPNQKGNYLGLEYQIIDDENHADAKLGVNGNRTLGSLYDLIRGSDEFRQLVAASKYKNLQGFGEMPKGHILLQGHGDTVHYRNIKIRNLQNI